MEVNEQTLYDDELLNILPDGVIIGYKWKNHTTKSASSYRTSCSFICQYNDAPPYKSDIQAIE